MTNSQLQKMFELPVKREFEKLTETEKELIASCPLAKPHSQAELDVYGMGYFHWPAWLPAWPCSLPAPAHLLTS